MDNNLVFSAKFRNEKTEEISTDYIIVPGDCNSPWKKAVDTALERESVYLALMLVEVTFLGGGIITKANGKT